MKKIILLCLALILSLSLMGCRVVDNETKDEDGYLASSEEIVDLKFTKTNGEVLMTEDDIEMVAVAYNEEEDYHYLYIKFTEPGAEKLKTVTAENVGNAIQMSTAKGLISQATINEAITDGKMLLTGRFTYDEIMQLFDEITE